MNKKKIWSKLREKWLHSTPEEVVRQQYVNTLINKYNFNLADIEEEVAIKVGSKGSKAKSADLVLYKNKEPQIVIECKAPTIDIYANDVEAQAVSYALQLQANYIVMTNGIEWIYKIKQGKKWIEINNLFEHILENKDIQIQKFTKWQFVNSLIRINDYIRDAEGCNELDSFDETIKILFCKQYAEKNYKSKLNEKTLNNSFLNNTTFKTNETGINGLFNEIKREYINDEIFDERDKVNLKPSTVKEIVNILENYNLFQTPDDIKGVVYEKFISKTLRGSLGQYFTPRLLIELALSFLNPSKEAKICDPACGTGGFLISYLNEILKETSKPEAIKIVNENIYGFDINEKLARVAKMNMILNGDGHTNIKRTSNSLLEPISNEYDYIFTNPPFGSLSKNKEIIKKYSWLCTKRLEKLFVAKCYEMLKPKGKMAIVLPIGCLNNKQPSDKLFRKFLLEKFNILGIFEFPMMIFNEAAASVITCLIFLEKKSTTTNTNTNINLYHLLNTDSEWKGKEILSFVKTKINHFKQTDFKSTYTLTMEEYSEYRRLDPKFYVNKKQYESFISKIKHKVKISDYLIEYKDKMSAKDVLNNNYKSIDKITKHQVVKFKDNLNPKAKNHLLVHPDSIFFSKMGAVYGQIYYYNKKSSFVATSEYPTFKFINNDFLPEFIPFVLRKKEYKDYIYGCVTGQGRQRLQVNDFLNIQIPKIPLTIQKSKFKKINDSERIFKKAKANYENIKNEVRSEIFKQ